MSLFKKSPPLWYQYTQWANWEIDHKKPTNIPLSHSLKIPLGFFHKFHHKPSKNSLSICLSILWLYLWVNYERTFDEWLRHIVGIFWTNLTKLRVYCGYIVKNPVGMLLSIFWVNYERTSDEWLRYIVDIFWTNLWKKPKGFFKQWLKGM